MKPLWIQDEQPDEQILQFTIGKDREFDNLLARHDIVGSVAHVKMLGVTGILDSDDSLLLVRELRRLYDLACQGKLKVEDDSEDIHSQLENMLTKRLGQSGERVHTGRSRNDQVLTAIRLYLRDEIKVVTHGVSKLFDQLISLAEQYKHVLMPGYTHMQVAMPSSFGLWFSAYAESLADDISILQSAYRLVNQNPLGSGAGYGSGFPLNREMTTLLLGFDDIIVNSVYAQSTRGKMEKTVAYALTGIAGSIGKMAADICLYAGQNYNFFDFPDKFVTGSSIMPHKRNPDVFEIIRGRCNKLQNLPNEISLITANLPTGYHRDFQLIKEILFQAIEDLKQCIYMSVLMLQHITVREGIVNDPIYNQMFSVEEVAARVNQGMSFREAYRQVAKEIREGKFRTDKTVKHTHIGSIGNLSLSRIRRKMLSRLKMFNFKYAEEAIIKLMEPETYQNIASD